MVGPAGLALPEVAVAPALLWQAPLLAPRPVPATPRLAQLPEVVAALAAEEEPEALVQLLSSQSFSAAMARTTP